MRQVGFSLHGCIKMHGQQTIKFSSSVENIILKVLNLPLIVTCGQVMFLSFQ